MFSWNDQFAGQEGDDKVGSSRELPVSEKGSCQMSYFFQRKIKMREGKREKAPPLPWGVIRNILVPARDDKASSRGVAAAPLSPLSSVHSTRALRGLWAFQRELMASKLLHALNDEPGYKPESLVETAYIRRGMISRLGRLARWRTDERLGPTLRSTPPASSLKHMLAV
ncbi:hypothetical protein NMY22_g12662 [Coprinellus aureogranulatus]|nr:hypothetical protein NMY22_g12662 [Coprinellus aureogranulatus]